MIYIIYFFFFVQSLAEEEEEEPQTATDNNNNTSSSKQTSNVVTIETITPEEQRRIERAERRANRRKEIETKNNKNNTPNNTNGFSTVTIETNVVVDKDKTSDSKKIEVKLNTDETDSTSAEDKKVDVSQDKNDRNSEPKDDSKSGLTSKRAERRRIVAETVEVRSEQPVESSKVELPPQIEKSKNNEDSRSLKKVDLLKRVDANDKISPLRKTNFESKSNSSRNRPGSTVDFKAKFESSNLNGTDNMKKRPVSMNIKSKFEAPAQVEQQKPVKFELRKTTSVPPKTTANKFEGRSGVYKFERKNESAKISTERSVTKTESNKGEGTLKQDIKEIKVVAKQENKTTTVTETKTTGPGGTLTTKKTETKFESSSKPGLKKAGTKSKRIGFICCH